jgi:hypothetical protein
VPFAGSYDPNWVAHAAWSTTRDDHPGFTWNVALGAVAYSGTPGVDKQAESQVQADLIRDIFNPFHPLTIDPTWLTGTIRLLAEAAYQERVLPSGELDPVRVAVLADALEEAGADVALLDHLRGPGLHVRGCHVVDLLTGRE